MAPPLIGLTGGIGSGKSVVADAFRALGVEVIDADDVAHTLSAPGNAGYLAIVAAFGNTVIGGDGRLDRRAMRKRAFAEPAFRIALERAMHPLIAADIDEAVNHWHGPYGVIVAPLLLERGNLLPRIDRVLVVDCPEDEQVRRTMLRSGLAAEDVRAIMATQFARDARLARADDVIGNAGEQVEITAKVARLDLEYRAMAQSHF